MLVEPFGFLMKIAQLKLEVMEFLKLKSLNSNVHPVIKPPAQK